MLTLKNTPTLMCASCLLDEFQISEIWMFLFILDEQDNKNVLKLFTCQYDLCIYVFI